MRPALLLILILLPLASALHRVNGQEKVSAFGEYNGYSGPEYEGWTRISNYITVRDGVQLAADIFRPTRDGKAVEEKLPVIWTFDRYHRADRNEGRLITQLDEMPWLRTVVRHGYVIGVVDVRGGGASFGTRQGELTQEEARDGYDITEWFASQSWCNKRVGMFGRSYLGISQYTTASTAPPHLVAIFPEMALFDLYTLLYPNGVFREDFVSKWSDLLKRLDTNGRTAPVDDDPSGVVAAKAFSQHKANISVAEASSLLPFRDSKDAKTGLMPNIAYSPSTTLEGVKKSKVAIYHLAGWNDLWPKDALLWYRNLNNPQRIIIGPWSHTQDGWLNITAERLRWFDYWLKGIDNGIVNEPPIHYFTIGAQPDKAWRSTWQWPLPDEVRKDFYLCEGRSGSVKSVNDGILASQAQESGSEKDDYTVDYTTTSGKNSRWANGYGAGFSYPDLRSNDEKGLTYTTTPLDSVVEVTGHPLVHLWISSTAKDADLYVYLEEVEPGGVSRYVSEGTLRTSHRSLSTPPYDNLGLPYHRSNVEDVKPLIEGEVVEVTFDLLPTSNIFDKGNRIRLTITCADRDNFQTQELSPPPVLTLHHNSFRPSRLTLPTIPVEVDMTANSGFVATIFGESPYKTILLIVITSIAIAGALAAFLIFRRRRRPAKI